VLRSIEEFVRTESNSAISYEVIDLHEEPPAKAPVACVTTVESALDGTPSYAREKPTMFLLRIAIVGILCATALVVAAIAASKHNEAQSAKKAQQAMRLDELAKPRANAPRKDRADKERADNENGALAKGKAEQPKQGSKQPRDGTGIPPDIFGIEERRGKDPSGGGSDEVTKKDAPADRKAPAVAQTAPSVPPQRPSEDPILGAIRAFAKENLTDRSDFKIVDHTKPLVTKGYNKKPAQVIRVAFEAKSFMASRPNLYDFLFVVQDGGVTEHAPTVVWIENEKIRQANLLRLAAMEAAAELALRQLSVGSDAFVGSLHGGIVPSGGWNRGSGRSCALGRGG
jgi:hypothetical protein